jgi:hypothetical protein
LTSSTGLLAEEAGDEELLDFGRGGDDGGESGGGIGADGDGDFEARTFDCCRGDLGMGRCRAMFAGAAGGFGHGCDAGAAVSVERWRAGAFAEMLGGVFLALPVHAGGLAVVDLHAVHAHVALAGAGSRVMTQGRVMKRPPSRGQHLRMGKSSREKLSRRMTSLQGASLAEMVLGKTLPMAREVGQHFELFEEAFGGFDFEEGADAAGDFVEGALVGVEAEGELHAAFGAELIDEDAGAGMAL